MPWRCRLGTGAVTQAVAAAAHWAPTTGVVGLVLPKQLAVSSGPPAVLILRPNWPTIIRTARGVLCHSLPSASGLSGAAGFDNASKPSDS